MLKRIQKAGLRGGEVKEGNNGREGELKKEKNGREWGLKKDTNGRDGGGGIEEGYK